MQTQGRKIFYFIFLLFASLFIFILCTFLFNKLLTKDISLEPVHFRSVYNKVYLISYADGPAVYFKNQNALAASAINKGIDFILNYRRSLLDPEFTKQYAHILSHKKGAGFWLWKPWIILKTLETMQENDVLFYADAGVLLRKPVTPLLSLTDQHDIVLLEYDPDHYWGKPINVTKREVFKTLDCDTEHCHYGKHVWAGFMILKNTTKSRDFIKRWLEYCSNEKLLTDVLDPSIQQYPEFKKHYHDEAILNTLYSKSSSWNLNSNLSSGLNSNSDLISNKNDIYLLPSKILFEQYATWHHRDPKIEEQSLLIANYFDIHSKAYKILNELLNNELTLWLFQRKP